MDRTAAACLPGGPRGMALVAVACPGTPVHAGCGVECVAIRRDAIWLSLGATDSYGGFRCANPPTRAAMCFARCTLCGQRCIIHAVGMFYGLEQPMRAGTSQALPYLTLALHFLRLAEAASAQISRRGNPHIVVSSERMTPAQYDRFTAWSDHTVGIAVLFNFYHGIELIIKGLLALQAQPPFHHRLTELLSCLEHNQICPALSGTLATLVRDIDSDSPIGRFLTANSIQIDSWYESLKYPKSAKGEMFSHTDLKYGSGGTVAFWRTIGSSAKRLRKQAVDCLGKINRDKLISG